MAFLEYDWNLQFLYQEFTSLMSDEFEGVGGMCLFSTIECKTDERDLKFLFWGKPPAPIC